MFGVELVESIGWVWVVICVGGWCICVLGGIGGILWVSCKVLRCYASRLRVLSDICACP